MNGAGKTTTLRAISGMIPVMAGTVRFGGDDITGQPAERITRRGLLHVPEGRGIFPNLRVDESLRLAAALAKLDAAEAGRPGGGGVRPPSRRWTGAGRRRPGRCRAASSRCWPWPGR